MQFRTEIDSLGEIEIPANAYWGAQSQRAINNFHISGYKTSLKLIKSLALVKKACAQSNFELGYLPQDKALAIMQACDEICEDQFDQEFNVDALQGGAGTSTNMNINEVIANRAEEIMGGKLGEYKIISPLDHVNMHQSTNDVYPTALKITAINEFRRLSSAVEKIQGALQNKEKEFAGILTIGRTEMQDAAPITLGSQFASFAEALARDRWRAFKCEERLRVVNIGGTAVGTGLAAPRKYIFMVIEKLRSLCGLGLTRAEQTMDATANLDALVEVSAILDANAANLSKIAGDLRLLHYFGEISLPPMQAGSSIMPGKVNPVIIETVMTASIKARSNTSIIAECAGKGSFQINEFIPLIAHSLLESLEILANANTALANHIEGITANAELCQAKFDNNIMLITAFVPKIGYKKCEEIAKAFDKNNFASFKEYLYSAIGKEIVDETLSAKNLMALGFR